MKKLIYSTFALGIVLSLSSFSSINLSQTSYDEIDGSSKYILNMETSSFTEYQDSKETTDKTVWSKRRKTWTNFSAADNNSILESIITRN